MKFSPRVLSLALVLGLVGAGAGYSCVSWNSDLGLDFWNAPLKDDLAQQEQVRLALNLRDVVVLNRIAVEIQEIVQAVVAGRLSLLEAAARFHKLNSGEAKLMADLRREYPSANDDECMCRNVIAYVKHHLGDDRHPLPGNCRRNSTKCSPLAPSICCPFRRTPISWPCPVKTARTHVSRRFAGVPATPQSNATLG